MRWGLRSSLIFYSPNFDKRLLKMLSQKPIRETNIISCEAILQPKLSIDMSSPVRIDEQRRIMNFHAFDLSSNVIYFCMQPRN